MDLEPKTQARILEIFERKVCSSCGDQAERISGKKLFCQECFLVQKNQSQQEGQISRIFVDPFPELLAKSQEMSDFIHQKGGH